MSPGPKKQGTSSSSQDSSSIKSSSTQLPVTTSVTSSSTSTVAPTNSSSSAVTTTVLQPSSASTSTIQTQPVLQQQPQQHPQPIRRVVTVIPNKEELVASTPNQRNWRGILIALLVIMAVLGLIVFSIVLLSPPDDGPRVKGRKLTHEDILSDLLQPPRFNGSWINDVELVYRDTSGGLTVYNADNLTTRVLMSNSSFRILNAINFSVSSDLNYVLLISAVSKVYRYSTEARYNIYEVATESHYALTPLGDSDEDAPLLQLVTWSPKGNALAFVYRNDIYYRPDASSNAKVIRLTDTGEPGVIFNGVPDWLYEEEILHGPRALWFSPDGSSLAYASFNDSLVGELQYSWYGSLDARLAYPETRSLRYPKAGTPNPMVTLWVMDLAGGGSGGATSRTVPVAKDIKPSLGVKEQDHYFTAVSWVNNRQVAVVWMNRRQNISIVSICSEPLWNCEDSHTEKQAGPGWTDAYDTPLFSEDGAFYLIRLPVLEGEAGRFPHVNLINVTSRRATPLSQGKYEVTRVLAWDEESHFVYFLAAPEGKPGQRHLYRVPDNASSATRVCECMTCSDSWPGPISNTSDHGPCQFSDAHFSPGSARFYVHECLGPEPPSVWLVEARTNTVLALFDEHSSLREAITKLALPQVRTFEVEVGGIYKAQVRLHLPPGLRDHEEMTFPLVLHVHAAPGSQLVSERWSLDWGSYLASNRNFIVAQIDGRGSGYQGDKLRHELHHRLGSVEVEDQIAVINYLRDNLKFIDKDHVAVWGWSYGGFATAMILARDEAVFRCGISVAPITMWTHYNSAYSERHMGLPNVTDNYRGYEEADVTKRAGNLKQKLFLLIHGTADDNVHYQQSMMLIQSLTAEGVLFRHQTYPDENHSFSGVKEYMLISMEAFLDDCFGPLDFAEWELGTSFFTFKQ